MASDPETEIIVHLSLGTLEPQWHDWLLLELYYGLQIFGMWSVLFFSQRTDMYEQLDTDMQEYLGGSQFICSCSQRIIW